MAKVRKAVITAAGRGTRQYPASAAVKKEMFPLVDRDGLCKPVIQIIGEEALDSGIEEICIVASPGHEQYYRDYFRALSDEDAGRFKGKDWALNQSKKLADFGKRLHVVVQSSAEGFGHAVYQAKDFVGNEPFLLMLGDHIYISDTKERCARQLINAFEKYSPAGATGVQPTLERDLHLFGIIQSTPIDNNGVYKAHKIVEKPSIEYAREHLTTAGIPAGNFLGHFGLHIFAPQIFDSLQYLIKNNLREKGEIQMTAAQEHLRQQTDNYLSVHIRGQRLDTGIPEGLMETQIALALNGVHRAQVCESIVKTLAMQVRE